MERQVPTDLIEPKVLARALSVHISTIHRWIHAGKLRAWRRAGERYLVSRAEGMALVVPVVVETEPGVRTRQQEVEAAEAARVRLRAKGIGGK